MPSDRPVIDELVTFVYSSDLDRSHRFYRGILGLEMVLDQGACRIYRVSSSGYVGVCNHREPEPAGVVVTIVSEDVDGWHATLTGAGISTDGPPRHNDRFDIYHFFATDPDGHHIEFQRFGSSWPGPEGAKG